MKELLGAAGRAFLRTFAAALIVYAAGISQAKNLNELLALGAAALLGALAAGLRALQAYVPKLTFAHWIGGPAGPIVDSFAHGFLAAFIAAWIGILGLPSLSSWHAAILAAIVGAFNAGIRAAQGALTHGEAPAPSSGVVTPPPNT